MVNRSICIHGHFYQPPRENPWLEAVERQDAVHPYHDWNEKITAECYAPNASSRILDKEGRIARMVSNYAKISFDVGPTLLAWLAKRAPEVYSAILEADRESQKLFAGHGAALAQVYNHMIMPLAASRDKRTQVVWGIKDFEFRFGRRPEGMWLPETAVDIETLELLADHGIAFTILAPHQAKQVRALGEKGWKDVSNGKIDSTMPYQCKLPSGKAITLFFYDVSISHDVAFGDLLKSGEAFAARLIGASPGRDDLPSLVHIATDGETYGHHHRFGDMALAYALYAIDAQHRAHLTNYGAYLENYPPRHEVEIFENTSWSCIHGVERWRSDCGCNTGAHPGWRQAWRAPLREAFDWLRDTLAPAFEQGSRPLLKDPWAARDAYIGIMLNRTRESVHSFFDEHAAKSLNDADKIAALKLLELQRHAMLMYTSCGWFYDDLSGIESVQVLQYAVRALQLARETFGNHREGQFLERLEQAKSNIKKQGDGRLVYERSVKKAMLDLKDVCAHYALCSLFEKYPERAPFYCYTIDQKAYQDFESGRAKLALGRAQVTSQITRESSELCFAVLHWGDQNINCGVGDYQGEETYQAMAQGAAEPFDKGDFPAVLRFMDKYFGSSAYSLKTLFRDEQRTILGKIMESTLQEAEAAYRQVYEYSAPMMRFLKDVGMPAPQALYAAAEIVLNAGLRRAFEDEDLDPDAIEELLEEARVEGITVDSDILEYTYRKNLERMADLFLNNPTDLTLLKKLDIAVDLVSALPFQVNLWKIQNCFYEVVQRLYAEFQRKADQGSEEAREWLKHFRRLGQRLYVRVE
jgi:alpha-amylase/alpha-mannosidase (GH57 family)